MRRSGSRQALELDGRLPRCFKGPGSSISSLPRLQSNCGVFRGTESLHLLPPAHRSLEMGRSSFLFSVENLHPTASLRCLQANSGSDGAGVSTASLEPSPPRLDRHGRLQDRPVASPRPPSPRPRLDRPRALQFMGARLRRDRPSRVALEHDGRAAAAAKSTPRRFTPREALQRRHRTPRRGEVPFGGGGPLRRLESPCAPWIDS